MVNMRASYINVLMFYLTSQGNAVECVVFSKSGTAAQLDKRGIVCLGFDFFEQRNAGIPQVGIKQVYQRGGAVRVEFQLPGGEVVGSLERNGGIRVNGVKLECVDGECVVLERGINGGIAYVQIVYIEAGDPRVQLGFPFLAAKNFEFQDGV